jgi:hypothetical protein
MNKDLLDDLVKALDAKKTPFLADLRSSIKEHISKKKTEDCLILVTEPIDGSRSKLKWYPLQGLAYASRFLAFVRKKNYVESYTCYTVDSVLTDEVIQLVTEKITRFYEKNNDVIANYFMQMLLKDKELTNALCQTLLDSKVTRFLSNRSKRAVMELLLSSFYSQFDQVKHIAATKIAAAVSAAAAVPVVKAITTQVTHFIATHLGVIMVKLMAIPAVKSLIVMAVKKFVVAAIISGFVKLVVAKLGVGVGSAVAITLVPILVGILAWEWMNFPTKLGEEVANAVAIGLESDFSETNNLILSKIFEQVGQEATNIGKSLADDPDIQNQVDVLISLVHA